MRGLDPAHLRAAGQSSLVTPAEAGVQLIGAVRSEAGFRRSPE
jgi:hypothetical protein